MPTTHKYTEAGRGRAVPGRRQASLAGSSSPSKFKITYVGQIDYPPGLSHEMEVDTWHDGRLADDEVIAGVGIRLNPGNTRCIWAKFKELDPATGRLVGQPETYWTGTAPAEATVDVEDSDLSDEWRKDIFLEGFAVRAAGGANVTTVHLWTKRIQADGTLGEMSAEPILVGARSADELHIVPATNKDLVLVSLGFGAKPGNITHLIGYYSKLVPR